MILAPVDLIPLEPNNNTARVDSRVVMIPVAMMMIISMMMIMMVVTVLFLLMVTVMVAMLMTMVCYMFGC